MNNQLNAEFISVIKQKISTEDSLVLILMDVLSLGKEAIYRRLRGEVQFTLDEVVKISFRFGISIDKIINKSNASNKSQWAVFDMNELYSSSIYLNQYTETLHSLLTMLDDMHFSKKAILRSALVMMPYSFLLPFEKLLQLRYYKWVYLSQGVNPDFTFSKMEIPLNILELQRQVQKKTHQTLRSLFILDRNVFLSIINDINYFLRRNLISTKEVQVFKAELFGLISFLETLAATGSYKEGAEVSIYLSDINLDASYFHLESDKLEICANWTYFVDRLNFYNAKFCQRQKEWIESLKRYSVQITQTGEIQRFEFLDIQRKLIEEKLR